MTLIRARQVVSHVLKDLQRDSQLVQSTTNSLRRHQKPGPDLSVLVVADCSIQHFQLLPGLGPLRAIQQGVGSLGHGTEFTVQIC